MRFIQSTKKTTLTLILILHLSSTAYAQEALADFCTALYAIAGLLASLMMAIHGLKWVMSESPQERLDAKKAIMYVLIGLLVVYMSAIMVSLLYCETIKGYDYNCPGPDCSVDCSLQAIGACNMQVSPPPNPAPNNCNDYCASLPAYGSGVCMDACTNPDVNDPGGDTFCTAPQICCCTPLT